MGGGGGGGGGGGRGWGGGGGGERGGGGGGGGVIIIYLSVGLCDGGVEEEGRGGDGVYQGHGLILQLGEERGGEGSVVQLREMEILFKKERKKSKLEKK